MGVLDLIARKIFTRTRKRTTRKDNLLISILEVVGKLKVTQEIITKPPEGR